MQHRTIRISDEEWEAFKRTAEANGFETASACARWLFREYVQEQERYIAAIERQRTKGDKEVSS